MNRPVIVAIASLWAVFVLAACCPKPPVQEPEPVDLGGNLPPKEPPAAPVVLDEGVYVIRVEGAEAGREEFTLQRSRDEEGKEHVHLQHKSKLTVGGHEMSNQGYLEIGPGWKPISFGSQATTGGGEVSTRASGSPFTMTAIIGGKSETLAATRDIDLYVAPNLVSHFGAVCSLPAEATTRWVFPGTELSVAAPVAVPEAKPVEGLSRRAITLAGSLAADVYCQGEKLIGLDAGLVQFVAVRAGSEDLFAQARRKERTKPALPDGLVEIERKVEVAAGKGVEAATLACSLVVPATHAEVKARATKGPQAALPAVALLTGSGKQDRDEDTYGPGGLKLSILKTIAIELGKGGIASLRCDDRGTGASTGDFEKATLQSFAADATAMLAALRAEPAVAPKRTGLVGHSEGAVVAPLVATTDRALKAIVLMAGPGRPLDLVSLEQVEQQAKAAGLPPDKVEAQLASSRAVFAAVRSGGPLPADVPPPLAAEIERSRAWLKSEIEHDPAATARTLKRIAVLIAQGDKDLQVAVADAEALRAAFAKAGNKAVEVKVYPNLNHLFAPSTTGNIAEYSDPEANVDAGFLADVVGFLAKRL